MVRVRVVLDPVEARRSEPLTEIISRRHPARIWRAQRRTDAVPVVLRAGQEPHAQGVSLQRDRSDAALDRAKAFIVAGLESGALKPRIARTFPLDAIRTLTASSNRTTRSARSSLRSDRHTGVDGTRLHQQSV
jgi:NADPH:quinone reductase-like Zn-dependent oxidoreductase